MHKLSHFDQALNGDKKEDVEPASVFQSMLRIVTHQLPRLEIIEVVKQYNAGGGGTEKLIGDLSAGLVVAGMWLFLCVYGAY